MQGCTPLHFSREWLEDDDVQESNQVFLYINLIKSLHLCGAEAEPLSPFCFFPPFHSFLFLKFSHVGKDCLTVELKRCKALWIYNSDILWNLISQLYIHHRNRIGTEYILCIYFFFSIAFLGPPEVKISSCVNCINVTIKLPTSHLIKNEKPWSLIHIYKDLEYTIILKTLDGEDKVKKFLFYLCIRGEITESIEWLWYLVDSQKQMCQ